MNVQMSPDLCVCIKRIDETPDVFTLVFQRADGRPFKFVAGQFVTLRFSFQGKTFTRVFTIASAATRSEQIALTIKASVSGNATRILHENFRQDCNAEIGEPSGKFTLPDGPVGKMLFIGAGSGITPTMSILRTLDDAGANPDLVFIQCARKGVDVLFWKEIKDISTRMNALRALAICSEATEGIPEFIAGRLDKKLLRDLVPDVAERTAYICGPAGLMRTMRSALIDFGVANDAIIEEAFDTELSVLPTEDQISSIFFNRAEIQFWCGRRETILKAASSLGIPIETECKVGACGSCKVRLLSGGVYMGDMGGLSESEREEGYVLACCTVPRGPIIVDL